MVPINHPSPSSAIPSFILHRSLSGVVDLLQVIEDEMTACRLRVIARKMRRCRSVLAGIAIDLGQYGEEDAT